MNISTPNYDGRAVVISDDNRISVVLSKDTTFILDEKNSNLPAIALTEDDISKITRAYLAYIRFGDVLKLINEKSTIINNELLSDILSEYMSHRSSFDEFGLKAMIDKHVFRYTITHSDMPEIDPRIDNPFITPSH